MGETTTPKPGTGQKISNAAWTVAGFAILPFAFIIAPLWVIRSFKEDRFLSLSNPDMRDKIQFETITTTPSIDRLIEVREMVHDLVEKQDWVKLSGIMQDWDQSHAAAPDGSRFARFALFEVANALAVAIMEGNACHPMNTPVIPEEVADHLEGIASIHPKHYPLAAISAYLRICRGWTHRGAEYSHAVSEDDWEYMGHNFKRALWLLEPHDAKELNAPLLAAVRFDLLAFLPDAPTLVHQYYTDWTTLDPTDQTPHEAYGFMLLPRWFGTFEMVEEAAQKAYAATHDITGATAYASVYAQALSDDIEALLHLDPDLYMEALNDVVTHTGADPAFVTELVQELQWCLEIPMLSYLTKDEKAQAKAVAEVLRPFTYHLARTRMTAIYLNGWEDGEREALDFISQDLKKEMRAGCSFVMGENGVEVIEGAT